MTNIVRFDSVSKYYSSSVALERVSFAVQEGSIHGFLGPNGAGKTTTMRILTGLLRPSDGEVEVFGKSIWKEDRFIELSIGHLPEHPPLYLQMTVRDYLRFVAKIFGIENNLSSLIDTVLNKTGLNAVGSRLIGNLSKGTQQRVGIAQAIIHNPKLLVLDEPTVGLDPNSIIEIRNLIKELGRDHTVFLSSHQLYEIEALCSEVTIINRGKIVESGTLTEIRKKFQSRQRIVIELDHWNSDWTSSLQSQLSPLALEYVSERGKNLLRFEFAAGVDLRARLSSAIFGLGASILSMREETMTLEDIFQSATKRGQG